MSQNESDHEEFSESSEEESSDNSSLSSSEDNVKSETNETSTKEQELKNQPFDEALDLSDEESIQATSPDTKNEERKESDIKNQPFDHALELSDSFSSPTKSASVSKPDDSVKISNENTAIKNKPFDEQMELSDSDSSVDTEKDLSSPSKTRSSNGTDKSNNVSKHEVNDKEVSYQKRMITTEPIKPMNHSDLSTNSNIKKKKSDSDDDSSEASEDSDEESQNYTDSTSKELRTIEGGYEEKEYEKLDVSQEIKELFQYIGRFKAQEIELEARLKCFIPEYIPAVGEMDAFLKVSNPNNHADEPETKHEENNDPFDEPIGLKFLDEPALIQSDATVLDLQLRSISRKKLDSDLVVRSIEDAEKNSNDIDRWINSIEDLHRNKPPPQVHYSKSMPDIDTLMQVWPTEMENILKDIEFPPTDMNVSLEEYVRLMCAILDIPVYKNMAESLHLMFVLFLEFRNNQHFAQI